MVHKVPAGRVSAAGAQLWLHFICFIQWWVNSFWSLPYSSPKVTMGLSVPYFKSFPQTPCSAPQLLTVCLFSLAVLVNAHCSPWVLSLETFYCYSKGSKLLFCLSERVTTWVLTSWLLSGNWKLPAVHKIPLAWNPTGHSICQPPAESNHALRYRVNLSPTRHLPGSDFWDSGCVF